MFYIFETELKEMLAEKEIMKVARTYRDCVTFFVISILFQFLCLALSRKFFRYNAV